METQLQAAGPATISIAQRRSLDHLRARYGQHRDLFDDRELARLRFVRWLYRTGHVTS